MSTLLREIPSDIPAYLARPRYAPMPWRTRAAAAPLRGAVSSQRPTVQDWAQRPGLASFLYTHLRPARVMFRDALAQRSGVEIANLHGDSRYTQGIYDEAVARGGNAVRAMYA